MLMPHLPQVNTHAVSGSSVIDFKAVHLRLLLAGIKDWQRPFLGPPHMLWRDAYRIHQNGIHALLLELLHVLQFLFAGQLTYQQNALIALWFQHPGNPRQEFPHGNGIHAGQHNANQFALAGFEPLGKKIRLKARLLNSLAHPHLFFYTDITVIQIAGHCTLGYARQFCHIFYGYFLFHIIPQLPQVSSFLIIS